MANALTDDAEVLFRQIHPKQLDEGEPDSSNFMPSRADGNMLSVDRGSLTTAAEAHSLYTKGHRESAAVYGLAVGEFRNEKINCFEDPLAASPNSFANPAHALSDYRNKSSNEQKKIARRLKMKAIARGKLYP